LDNDKQETSTQTDGNNMTLHAELSESVCILFRSIE